MLKTSTRICRISLSSTIGNWQARCLPALDGRASGCSEDRRWPAETGHLSRSSESVRSMGGQCTRPRPTRRRPPNKTASRLLRNSDGPWLQQGLARARTRSRRFRPRLRRLALLSTVLQAPGRCLSQGASTLSVCRALASNRGDCV